VGWGGLYFWISRFLFIAIFLFSAYMLELSYQSLISEMGWHQITTKPFLE